LKQGRNPPVQVVVNEHKSLSNSIDEDDEQVFGEGSGTGLGSGGLIKIQAKELLANFLLILIFLVKSKLQILTLSSCRLRYARLGCSTLTEIVLILKFEVLWEVGTDVYCDF
jgi:hypothetical protein